MSQLLQAETGPDAFPTVKVAKISPASAAAHALMAYLGEITFGESEFRLANVLDEWPTFGDDFKMPCASVLEMPPDDGDEVQLVPFMLEDTVDCHGPGTVLWKTDEHSLLFQVDFWAQNKLQREAIHAKLDAAFSPTEVRTGVLLKGSPDYWDLSVRATLESVRREDSPSEVKASDRRLRAVVRCDVDAVHLRRVTRLSPRVIIETVDP